MTNKIYDGGDLSALLLKTRIKNEIERGKLLEAKVKLETGRLIPAEEVRKTAATKLRILQKVVLDAADRAAPSLVKIGDVSKIREILEKAFGKVFEELDKTDSG
jgi:GMP synthase PP-ATPase subunit